MTLPSKEIKILKNYPNNGKHLELIHNIPNLKITLGEDSFFYDGYKKESKTFLWYIFNENYKNENSFAHEKSEILGNKGFKTKELAYSYAFKSYKKHVKNEIKRLQSVLNNICVKI